MDELVLICVRDHKLFKRGKVYKAEQNNGGKTWTIRTEDGFVVAPCVTRYDLDYNFTVSTS